MLNKVPAITLIFWILKIMATTVGETAADFLSVNMNLGLVYTSCVMSGLLLISLIIQLRSKKYIPWIYWTTVVFISVMGTLISDNLVDNLGVSLSTTTIIFSVALVLVFTFWYLSEKTLSVHTIATTRRELFYWAAILFTFALGTSAGDLLSESFGLGYLLAAIIFIVAIGVIYVAYRYLQLNAILAFWLAYILTRPLGASLGDLLTQPATEGGLAIPNAIINLLFFICIIGLVIYLSKKERSLATHV